MYLVRVFRLLQNFKSIDKAVILYVPTIRQKKKWPMLLKEHNTEIKSDFVKSTL